MRPYRLTAQRRFLAQVRAASGLALLARGLPEVQAGLDHFLGGRASWVGTYPLPPDPVAGGEGVVSLSAPRRGTRGLGGDQGSGGGR